VAYRGGRRWVQTFESVRFDHPAAAPSLRRHGVYLITGGLGNIGLVLADYLARAVQARLVLVGRSTFPRPEDWNAWLAEHDERDPVSEKIIKLRALEALGAEILVVAGDIADPANVRDLLARVDERFGGLNGVIHGAGHTGANSSCAIAQLDRAACESHFQPKIYGLLALEDALRNRAVDFWMLVSSLSAVLGGLGFAAYAAANAFLDAFATRKNQDDGPPWISVDWDGWQFPSTEAGSGGAPAFSTSILPEEGVQIFQRILRHCPRQPVAVSTVDLQTRLDQWVNLASLREAQQTQEPAATSRHARPSLPTAYVPPRNPTEEQITALWQQLLGIDQIGIHDNFFELGGHSLLGIQLISQLQGRFRIELSAHRLFEAPTVAELAEIIDHAHRAQDEKIAELLKMVEGLSEVEVEELLAQQEAEG
jgi:NAD(P)-dependent dehydrogenase (short-subunit alcohol dehydrogenase family)/acyl carrier protein